MQFMFCIVGYVIFYLLAVNTNILDEWTWWSILLSPVLAIAGLMMQIIPYEYLKERLEERSIDNADHIALGIWITVLVIYGIAITVNADIA